MTLTESHAYDVAVADYDDDMVGFDAAHFDAAHFDAAHLDAARFGDADSPVDAIIVDALALDANALDADIVEAELVEVAEPARLPEPGGDPKERRHLRVAPDSVRRRRRVRIAAAGAAVSISATLFAVVGFNVELAQHQIQLQHMQEQLQAEQTHYYDLRKQVAERSAPATITAEAQHLGLTQSNVSYIQAPIPPPPSDPTGTSGILKSIHDNAGGSLANLQP
jgi:cell division protein FtsL